MARKSDLVEQAEEWAGCYTIYACRFASGLTKVGLTSDLPKRIASHWNHGLSGLQSFRVCEASSEAHMREAEKAAHALWGPPIHRKDSREVFETRGTPADDRKRLERAIDDTSPTGWKRRMRRSWRRRVRVILFSILAVLIVLLVIDKRPRPDAYQQAAPVAPDSANVPVQNDGVSAPTQADRLKAAKALIDARMAAVNGPACSESAGSPLSVHITFDRMGAASGLEVVRSSSDPHYDTCKLGAIRQATSQLLYINGMAFEGDVIYTINGAASALEAAPSPAPVPTPAPAPASAPESGLPPDVEQFIATHIVTADCDSRASCLALYARTIAAANAAQPASAAP